MYRDFVLRRFVGPVYNELKRIPPEVTFGRCIESTL